MFSDSILMKRRNLRKLESLTKISGWFINIRKRLLKEMLKTANWKISMWPIGMHMFRWLIISCLSVLVVFMKLWWRLYWKISLFQLSMVSRSLLGRQDIRWNSILQNLNSLLTDMFYQNVIFHTSIIWDLLSHISLSKFSMMNWSNLVLRKMKNFGGIRRQIAMSKVCSS